MENPKYEEALNCLLCGPPATVIEMLVRFAERAADAVGYHAPTRERGVAAAMAWAGNPSHENVRGCQKALFWNDASNDGYGYAVQAVAFTVRAAYAYGITDRDAAMYARVAAASAVAAYTPEGRLSKNREEERQIHQIDSVGTSLKSK